MDKKLALDIDNFLANSTTGNSNLVAILESLTSSLQNADNRNGIPLEFFVKLTQLFQKSENDVLSVWILRVLRNAVVNCTENQDLLYESETVEVIINQILDRSSSSVYVSFYSQSIRALGLQVIGNSIVSNPNNCQRLWTKYNVMNWMTDWLKHGDSRVCNYAAMIGRTLTQLQPEEMLGKLDAFSVQLLFEHVHIEFVMLWVETLIAIENFLPLFYPQLEEEVKVKCLYTFGAHSKVIESFSDKNLALLVSNFKNSADQILTTNSSSVPDDFNVLETTAMAELFCKFMQNDHLAQMMKSDTSFVISTIALLRSIHEIGASGDNCFTPVDKLDSKSEDLMTEPGFLFKADLIRLLGFLVQGSEVNQNQVREMGVLPVILNCTKIDSRNPFIPQCSIVTLKFLVEGNPENQAYVRKLKQH